MFTIGKLFLTIGKLFLTILWFFAFTIVLTNPNFDDGIISVTYTDFDNNLATVHDVFIDDKKKI